VKLPLDYGARQRTDLARWLRAVYRPDAVVISHNELLISYARSRPKSIGFQHATALYAEVAKRRAPNQHADTHDVVRRLARPLVALCSLHDERIAALLTTTLELRFA
jgi:hypothetical protein